MDPQLKTLLEDVQKHILNKPMGTNLYVSEESFAFFKKGITKEQPVTEKMAIYSPTPIVRPLPPPKIYEQKPPSEPAKKPPEQEREISGPSAKIPSYDFNALKDIVAHIKPGLKILEKEPTFKKVVPSCLIFGLSSQDEQEVMENIKKAIVGTLKKTALVTSEEALLHEKNVQLSIISEELLEKSPHLQGLFKEGTGGVHYLAAIPALSVKTFRGLTPQDKRLLWNQIKVILS